MEHDWLKGSNQSHGAYLWDDEQEADLRGLLEMIW